MYHEDDMEGDYSDEESMVKKRKVVQACDACRKKKVKCDGSETKECSNCQAREIQCIFTPTATKRGPRQGYIENLEKRLELMEKLLQPLKNIDLKGGSSPAMAGGDSMTSQEELLSLTQTGGANHGLSLTSELSGMGNTNSREGDHYLVSESALMFPTIPSPPTPPVPVISPETSEHLISLYFTYQHPLLPIIHRTTFLNSFKENNQCSLLLYTIYALAARFSTHPEVSKSPCYSSGEECITHAKILLESPSYSTPYITTVQALVLMSLHELGCDRYPTAWMYSGLAVRMGQHLNLYCTDKNDAGSKLDWVEAETRRRTWFGCCLMDRLLSTKTSWPMAIHDEDCQVRFPSEDYKWENDMGSHSEASARLYQLQSDNSPVPVPDHMLQFGSLVSIMGKVNHYANRSTNVKKLDTTSVSLMDLDNMLQVWTMELPPPLQYSPDFLDSRTPDSIMTSSAIIMLHSLFHAITIVLHRSNIGRFLNNTDMIHDVELSALRCQQSAAFLVDSIEQIQPHRFIQYIPFYSYALFTAGSIYANQAFSTDSQVAESSKSHLQTIYRTLQSLTTYWGICRTYCTSLKGLFVLRSSRNVTETVSSNSAALVTIMNWLVPQKSSLHDWFPYLEKLSKEIGDDFCRESISINSIPSEDPMVSLGSPNPLLSNSTPVMSDSISSNPTPVASSMASNPMAHSLSTPVPNSTSVPSLGVTSSSSHQVDPTNFLDFGGIPGTGAENSQPTMAFNDTELQQLLGFDPNLPMMDPSTTFNPDSFQFDFGMMGGNQDFMQDMNNNAFLNMSLATRAGDTTSQPAVTTSQPPPPGVPSHLPYNYNNP